MNASRIEEFIRRTERVIAAGDPPDTPDGRRADERFRRTMEDSLRRFLKAFAPDHPSDLFSENGPVQMAGVFYRMEPLPHPEDKYTILRRWEEAWHGRGGTLRWKYSSDATLTLCFSPKHEGGYHEVAFTPLRQDKIRIPLSFPLRVTATVWEDMDTHVCADEVIFDATTMGDEAEDYECFCEPQTVAHEVRDFADPNEWEAFTGWLRDALSQKGVSE